jgi:hypothetical protein
MIPKGMPSDLIRGREPVFGKDHAQTKDLGRDPIRSDRIAVEAGHWHVARIVFNADQGIHSPGAQHVDVQEVRKIDAYLKKLFGNARIRVVPRAKKEDSAEVYIGEEFIGVLFVDDEDEERSYNFQMAILGTDLE